MWSSPLRQLLRKLHTDAAYDDVIANVLVPNLAGIDLGYVTEGTRARIWATLGKSSSYRQPNRYGVAWL
jgi:hypothetical protein